jgi:hypothetical protein
MTTLKQQNEVGWNVATQLDERARALEIENATLKAENEELRSKVVAIEEDFGQMRAANCRMCREMEALKAENETLKAAQQAKPEEKKEEPKTEVNAEEKKEEPKVYEFEIDEEGDPRKNKVYVAKITGLDEKFGLARDFETGLSRFTGKNSVRLTGTLKAREGDVFEISNGEGSWKNPNKDFYIVKKGELEYYADATTSAGKAKVARLFQK